MLIIKKAEISALAARESQYPPEDRPEIAFAGRSNVGKSSLLNILTMRKNLARTSSAPGKTRTINFFDVEGEIKDGDESTPVSFRIVDLPGYGYAKVSKKVTEDWGRMMEEYLQNRDNLMTVFQLVDSRHEPTAQDVQMYDYLKYYGLSGVVVATKQDKCKKSELAKNIRDISKKLDLTEDDIIIPVSALKRTGTDKVLDLIGEILESKQGE